MISSPSSNYDDIDDIDDSDDSDDSDDIDKSGDNDALQKVLQLLHKLLQLQQ